MISDRFDDLLGKSLLTLAFGGLLVQQLLGLIALVSMAERPDFWWLTLFARALTLVFVTMVVLLTLRRLPARSTAAGLEPRLAAIAGTFLLLVIAWLPAGETSVALQLFATGLVFLGTMLSVYCLHYLGRSFSVLASARALVTSGPYARVRHPLYVAEAITTLGIILLHWSFAAAIVGAVQVAIQFRRMRHEEAVLRAAFPEYEDYAERVAMVFPRSRPAIGEVL